MLLVFITWQIKIKQEITLLTPNESLNKRRHTCLNNLPRVALVSAAAGIRTRDLLIASPASEHALGRRATQRPLYIGPCTPWGGVNFPGQSSLCPHIRLLYLQNFSIIWDYCMSGSPVNFNVWKVWSNYRSASQNSDEHVIVPVTVLYRFHWLRRGPTISNTREVLPRNGCNFKSCNHIYAGAWLYSRYVGLSVRL